MTTPGTRGTVLVTGAGAPPGVSIFKALRQSPLEPRVVATDAIRSSPRRPGTPTRRGDDEGRAPRA